MRWNIGYRPWETNDRCPLCGSVGHVKPNVVFFNEFPPNYRFFKRAFKDLEHNDIVLVTGTSGKVISVGRYLNGMPLDTKSSMLWRRLPLPKYTTSAFCCRQLRIPIIDRILRDRITRRF